jgi:hypothetical protein
MTGVGPLIMAALVAIFLGSLFRLRVAGVSRKRERILTPRPSAASAGEAVDPQWAKVTP